ncbi:MAG: hypothetical protein GF408_01310 [Candidatus Omnitrophica bacterium]|nr:hypothetical protein [Candidatus Omnitrophota bacterium]
MMKKSLMTAVIALIFCAAVSSSASAYTCSYTQEVKTPYSPPMVSKVWVDGGNMRIESSAGGEKYVLIMRKDGIYNYIPSQNIVTKVPNMQGGTVAYLENPQEYISFLEGQGARKVGTDRVGPYSCDVYEYGGGRMSPGRTKVWVWQKENFPVKMTVDGPRGNTTEVIFSDISVNKPIPPGKFQLPSGATVFDATNMGGLAEMMKQYAR